MASQQGSISHVHVHTGVHVGPPMVATSAGYDQPSDPPSYAQVTEKTPIDPNTPPTHHVTYNQYGAQTLLVDQYGQHVVTQQPYNVVLVAPPRPVSSSESVCQLVWAIFNCLFCFWPLGIVAIVFSSMAVDAARHGMGERARHYSRVALWLNVTSLIVGIVLLGVFIGLAVANSGT